MRQSIPETSLQPLFFVPFDSICLYKPVFATLMFGLSRIPSIVFDLDLFRTFNLDVTYVR